MVDWLASLAPSSKIKKKRNFNNKKNKVFLLLENLKPKENHRKIFFLSEALDEKKVEEDQDRNGRSWLQ